MRTLRSAKWVIGIAVLASALSISGCTLFQSQAIVDLQAAPTTGAAPLRVDFTPTVEGNAVSYSWDFGDGTTSESPSASHIYRALGTYTVTLTVHLSDGRVAHVTKDNLIDITGVMTTTQPNPQIVWLDRSAGTISRGPRSGGTVVTVAQAPPYKSIRAIAVAHGKVYWTTYSDVERCNLDGSDHQIIYRPDPVKIAPLGGIAVDTIANKIYWAEDPVFNPEIPLDTDPAEIWRADLNGSGAKIWANTSLWNYSDTTPSVMTTDAGNHRLYWTATRPSSPFESAAASIHWADTSSSQPQNHTAFSSLPEIGGIAVDNSIPGGIPNLYWTTPSKNQLWSGYVGRFSKSRDLLMNAPHPEAIAVDAFNGKIYWSSGKGIYRANLQDGSDKELIYPGVHADALALAN
jgi:PKD repeat protein